LSTAYRGVAGGAAVPHFRSGGGRTVAAGSSSQRVARAQRDADDRDDISARRV